MHKSATGTYRIGLDGKSEKISDKIPPLASRQDGVYFRQPYFENFGGAGNQSGVEITSKGQKKQIMKEKGIREFEESVDDVKPETAGKIMSFPGQKHCDRTGSKDIEQARKIRAEI